MIQPITGDKSNAIRRTVEANRAVYDYARPSPGKTEDRVIELEAALTQTRHRLRAIEGSTIWKSTKRLRRLIQAVKNLRQPVVSSPAQMDNATRYRILTYQDWIETAEPTVIKDFLCPGAGRVPVMTPRLGLVLWTDERRGSIVAKELDARLKTIPAIHHVMMFCPSEIIAEISEQVSIRPNLVFESAETFAGVFSVALHRMNADYLCFHHLTDGIAHSALEIVATALANQLQTDLLFGDEDWLDEAGHRDRPCFKPGWDLELQRGQDLVGPFAFYRTANLHALGNFEPSGPAWRYDLAGRIVAACQPDRVRHVPVVLCHRRVPSPVGTAEAMRHHAKMHLLASGIMGDIEAVNGPEPWHRVVYALPQSAPLVSIIVPTRDRVELLRSCTNGVLRQTSYPQIELVIVDNGTEEADALALLDILAQDGRVRILRRPGPFNWSALNNAAVDAAYGEVLVLLNNDITVLRPNWLNALVAFAIQPDVGAVGAKLLYQDGRVQHAGITTDIRGMPRHLFRYSKPDDAGPSGILALSRSVWAVTGACLAIRRAVFLGVGGLNESLPVTYNDVDLCMRLTVQGYRIIWTPDALLEHCEFASRPPDHVGIRREQVREERYRLTRDWGNLVLRDPFLNPNYELVGEHLAFRTWRDIAGTENGDRCRAD